MGRYLVYCVFVIVPFYTYSYGFLSGGKKDSGVKLCVLVRLLSAMSFSHFGEIWLAGTHGGGISSGMSCIHLPCTRGLHPEAECNKVL